MPSNSMWYGETREYTPSELNFMVSAVANCQKCQELGMCKPGACCVHCNYGAAMQATESLDALTKSRVYDKADTLNIIRQVSTTYQLKKEKSEKRKLLFGYIFLALLTLLVFMIPVFERLSCHDILPKIPNTDVSYNWKENVQKVMDKIKSDGVYDCYIDGSIDCKDYSYTFLIYWYNVFNFDTGTCVFVQNSNYQTDFHHLFIAVWTGDRWKCIEPQAYYLKDWSIENFWGNKYNAMYNDWSYTYSYITSSRFSFDFEKQLAIKAGYR